MKDVSAKAGRSAKAKIENADLIVKSIERIFIVIGVAVILLFICFELIQSSGYGYVIIAGGIALIFTLVLLEILLFDRHRHQNL